MALPAFGTPWALRDIQPVPKAAPIRAAAPVVVGPDHRPLYAMIAALSVAVASLGAYVIMRPPPPTTTLVERAVVVAPEAAPEAALADEPADEPAPSEHEEAAPEAVPAPEAAPVPAPAAPRARGPRSPRSSGPSPAPEPKQAAPKGSGVIPVECVIDPSACDGAKPKPGKPKQVDAPEPPKGALPEAPSSSQIRDAMAVVKPQAKACGGRMGGTPGQKVRVKLSVAGATGKVTSAQALDDHAGTALGRCVADALAKAELPRFSKPTAGVVYAVTL